MKRIKLYIYIILSGICTSVVAQNVKSTYFMDMYSYNHLINPAKSPCRGYIGIPALGNLTIDIASNLSLDKLFYPVSNGKIGTFLHNDVSEADALSKFKENNYLDANVYTDLLSFGFYQKDMFFSFDLGLKVEADVNLPFDLFRLAKRGMSQYNTQYNLRNLSVNADAYVEIALGYAMDIKQVPGLRVGGKLKALVAGARVDAMFDNINIKMSGDEWLVQTEGYANVYSGFVEVTPNDTAPIPDIAFDATKILPLPGWGGAIDIGAEYTMWGDDYEDEYPTMRFSLGLTDLGWITYKNNTQKRLVNNGEFKYLGADDLNFSGGNITVNDGKTIEDFAENMVDDVLKLIELNPVEITGGNYVRVLRPTLAAGVQAAFIEDKLSVGLLYTGRYGKLYSNHELTTSVNIHPTSWFGFGLSASFLRDGFSSVGFALNLAPNYGANFFVMLDYFPFEYTAPIKELAGFPFPLKTLNLNAAIGLTVPLAKGAFWKNKYNRKNSEYVEIMR